MKRENKVSRGRKQKMLKEMIRNQSSEKLTKRSATEEALMEFQKENGYSFLDMTNDEKIRMRHKLKQLQKKEYDDDDFLDKFQDYQGD